MNFYKKKVFKNLYPCTCVHVVCVHVIICSVNSEWNDIILIVLYIIIIFRASDISRKKSKILRDFQGQIRGKIG